MIFVKKYYESKSIIAVQRAFVNKHNLKSASSRKSILAAVKNFEKMETWLVSMKENEKKVQNVFKRKNRFQVTPKLILIILNDDIHRTNYTSGIY